MRRVTASSLRVVGDEGVVLRDDGMTREGNKKKRALWCTFFLFQAMLISGNADFQTLQNFMLR